MQSVSLDNGQTAVLSGVSLRDPPAQNEEAPDESRAHANMAGKEGGSGTAQAADLRSSKQHSGRSE